MTENKKFFVYWIVSGRSSYIGATVDPVKRLKQHCGLLAGGAKRTRGKLWRYKCVISGFRTWKEALCLEWAAKYYSRNCRGIESRRIAIENVMKRERWTSNSPLSIEVPLTVQYDPETYGFPPETLPEAPKKRGYKRSEQKRNFKKNLHGVSY